MSYIEIEDRDWAMNVMLQSIIQDFGSTSPSTKNESKVFYLHDRIELCGKFYVIPANIFKDIMEGIAAEKAIKLNDLTIENAIDSEAVDPEEYVFMRMMEEHGLAEKTIKSDKIAWCSFTVENIDIIKKQISRLNKSGSSVDEARYRHREKKIIEKKGGLRSIHLITEGVAPKDKIFLVFNEEYSMPFRFDIKNYEGGDTYIKKLHNIAYFVDAPGKKVDYDENLAKNINNGLFRRRPIRDYMKTNKFKKPTLVQKKEDGKSLVLKGTIPVETILIKNIPRQHRFRYTDKTK